MLLASLAAGRAVAAAAPAPTADAAYHFALARLEAAAGDVRQAGTEFEAAARLAPADPYVRIEYAGMLLRQAQTAAAADRRARLAEARTQAAAAARLAPANPDAQRALAQVCLVMADDDPAALDAARQALEAVLKVAPDDVQSLITLGQIDLGRDDAAHAADLLQRALALRPDNRSVPPMLVDALLRSGRSAEAEALLRGQLEADPAALRARLALVGLLSARGEHAAAVDLLRSTPETQRDLLDVRRQLAYELLRSGALEEALAVTEPALRAGAGPGVRYLRAMILAAMARSAEAEQELATLHDAAPDNADLALDLARVRQRLGRTPDAIRALRETLDALGRSADAAPETIVRVRLMLASTCQGAKDFACAETAIRPLLDAKAPPPVRDAALELQADLLLDQGRGEDALALLADTSAPALLAKRGEVLLRVKRGVEARRVLDGLATSSDGAQALLAAEAYQRAEDYAASVPILERARERDPKASDVAFRLAAAYERTGRRADAIRLFRDLVKATPYFAPALNYLGYMLAEKGEALDEALKLTRRAVEIEPDNGAYVDSLGWAHYQLGQYPEARRYLERASGLMPEDATVREHLGDVYVKVGELGRARECYERALKMGGENAAQVERKLRGLSGGS